MIFDKYRIIDNKGIYFIQERGFLWFWKEPDRVVYFSSIESLIKKIHDLTNHKQRYVTIVPMKEVFHC